MCVLAYMIVIARVCVKLCMCMYTYVCVCVCIHVRICMHACMLVCIHVSLCPCLRMYVSVCLRLLLVSGAIQCCYRISSVQRPHTCPSDPGCLLRYHDFRRPPLYPRPKTPLHPHPGDNSIQCPALTSIFDPSGARGDGLAIVGGTMNPRVLQSLFDGSAGTPSSPSAFHPPTLASIQMSRTAGDRIRTPSHVQQGFCLCPG